MEADAAAEMVLAGRGSLVEDDAAAVEADAAAVEEEDLAKAVEEQFAAAAATRLPLSAPAPSRGIPQTVTKRTWPDTGCSAQASNEPARLGGGDQPARPWRRTPASESSPSQRPVASHREHPIYSAVSASCRDLEHPVASAPASRMPGLIRGLLARKHESQDDEEVTAAKTPGEELLMHGEEVTAAEFPDPDIPHEEHLMHDEPPKKIFKGLRLKLAASTQSKVATAAKAANPTQPLRLRLADPTQLQEAKAAKTQAMAAVVAKARAMASLMDVPSQQHQANEEEGRPAAELPDLS